MYILTSQEFEDSKRRVIERILIEITQSNNLITFDGRSIDWQNIVIIKVYLFILYPSTKGLFIY